MLKLGIIGTNWITEQFINAAQETGKWQLTSVYSRTLQKAQEFGEKFNGDFEYFTDLAAFFAEGTFDAVYIASPNSLHFAQAKQAILAGKDVIVEKPACSNPTEMQELVALLEEHPEVFLFEAARHVHEPNFKAVTKAIEGLNVVQGATLTYAKYSSRYDAVLAGKEPNIFSPAFSGGCVQDLGVYLVYDAVVWFGEPDSVDYHAVKLPTGVDGSGVASLHYDGFDVTLNLSKTFNSYLPGEIYGLKDTIRMDHSSDLNKVELDDGNGHLELLSVAQKKNPMTAEAEEFAAVLNDKSSPDAKQLEKDWLVYAVLVNKVLYQLRQSAQIKFKADQTAAEIEEEKNES
ncbi:oxidoreductase [Ligilactobacillus salitolerans]|uniref:Oxidoreductase n=1 Tax=Ligilactobacillus salitolerans TaxID=1808352 RepID=A0A401IW72_9LACO|nr:Gfo/Idh/MocA family oxidoreductase [Ligilactobacillus salitolerans]GBG95800.1 oxidoreductase [Ligilactobacillus salitolerans]